MSTIGSNSWIGPGNYEEGGRFHTRVERLAKAVDWDALLEKYSCGHFNVVRKIEFADGVD